MALPKQFFVTVPTQTYISRFLTSRYGQVIPIHEKTLLGKDLLNMIRYPLGCQLSSSQRNLLYGHYNDQLKLSIPLKLKNSVVHDLSIEHIVTINQYLKKYFDTQLCQFCIQHINSERKNKVGYKQAIEIFARMHKIDLEEDISYECLKKSDYRFRQKMELRTNHTLVTAFPSTQISCFN